MSQNPLRLSVTLLEDRITPRASIVVTKFNWDANTVGSLPWAINKANTDAGPDDIVFDLTGVVNNGGQPLQRITVGSTLNITESVRIIGPEANPQGDHPPNPLNSVVEIFGKRPFWFSHSKPGGADLRGERLELRQLHQ